MAKYFKFPFADAGDKAAIPETAQIDGSVSYVQGFGPDYELIYPTNPNAKPMPRDNDNQLNYDMTNAIKQYQEYGINDFITTADNQGVPFPYDINSFCRYDSGSGFNVYQSLETANSTLPTDTTKWRILTATPSSINTTTILTDGDINNEFYIDLTAGDIDITFPAEANWADGDKIKLRIVKADAGEDNRLRIISFDGVELISSFPSHDFYFTNSYVTVKKVDNVIGLIIDDYDDAKSIMFKAYFANGQSQVGIVANTTPIEYPTIITNQGSFYNSGTGVATLKIPGEYQFIAGAYFNISSTIQAVIKGYRNGTEVAGSASENQTEQGVPNVYTTFNIDDGSIADLIDIRIDNFDVVASGLAQFPAFNCILLKRTI